MPRVTLANDKDTDLIISSSSPEHSPIEQRRGIEMRSDVETGYTTENFDYRVFSDERSSAEAKSQPPGSKWLHNNNAMNSLQQFVVKIRQIPMCPVKTLPTAWTTITKIVTLVTAIIILLLLFIILCIQLSRSNHENWLHSRQCISGICLTAAGALQDKLNKSVSPCDNFYRYACGSHAHPSSMQSRPDVPAAQGAHLYRAAIDQRVVLQFNREKAGALIRIHRPAIDHLTELNIHAIIMGLKNVYNNHSHQENSAKLKIAQWFSSCTNRYFRNWVGTRRFMQTAARSLGGIWLLDRQSTNETGAGGENSTTNWPNKLFYSQTIDSMLFVPANWSWMKAIQQLHVDLHLPVFVDFSIKKEGDQPVRIHFYPENGVLLGGRYQEHLREYISQLLQLLVNEAKIPITDEEIARRIKQATDDFIFISTRLFEFYRISSDTERPITLGELNSQSKTFDWKGLLGAYFSEVGFTFSESYEIYTYHADYLRKLSPFLDEMRKNFTEAIFNRMLNNYMLCNILDSFAWHLSYDFVSLHNRWNGQMDSDLEVDCFNFMHELFPTILGAIYVQNHMNDDAVKHSTEMLNYLKSMARNQIDRTTWLDETSKRNIENRIDNLKIKFTVPELMTNEAKLDYAYRKLQTSYIYIENLLSVIQYSRGVYNRLLAGIAEPIENDWLADNVYVYDAKIGIHVVSDELYVPIGALQPPVYHHTLPQTLNFAGLGTMLGSAMAQLIGYLGAFHIKNPYETLWSDDSWTEYLRHVDCVHYKLGNDTSVHFNLSSWMADYVSRSLGEHAINVINEATGLRIAHEALNQWTTDNVYSLENSSLPGEHWNQNQLFYLTYAQTFCEMTNERMAFYELYFGAKKIPHELIVNHILSELPEFAATFNCPVGSIMNPEHRCAAVL